jgi:hypothetical protein
VSNKNSERNKWERWEGHAKILDLDSELFQQSYGMMKHPAKNREEATTQQLLNSTTEAMMSATMGMVVLTDIAATKNKKRPESENENAANGLRALTDAVFSGRITTMALDFDKARGIVARLTSLYRCLAYCTFKRAGSTFPSRRPSRQVLSAGTSSLATWAT